MIRFRIGKFGVQTHIGKWAAVVIAAFAIGIPMTALMLNGETPLWQRILALAMGVVVWGTVLLVGKRSNRITWTDEARWVEAAEDLPVRSNLDARHWNEDRDRELDRRARAVGAGGR